MTSQDRESKHMRKENTNNMGNRGRDRVEIDVEALTSLDTLKSGNIVMSCECCIFKNRVEIDVEALTYSLDTLISDNFVMSRECCIFKTPNILRRHKKEAYAPNAFSIGPWHLGKPHLEATQKIKKKYLQGLIGRFSDSERKLRELEDAISSAISSEKNNPRDCYEGSVDHFNDEELVKILVLDGCFIIEFFRKKAIVEARDKDDPIFNMACMLQFLNHDLVLLENQIPWFVLEILFKKTKTPTESKSLHELVMMFFKDMAPDDYSTDESIKLLEQLEIKHILHLLWNGWLKTGKEVKSGNTDKKEETKKEDESGNTDQKEEKKKEEEFGKGKKKEAESGKGSESSECGKDLLRICWLKLGCESKKKDRFKVLPCATSLRENGITIKKGESSSNIVDIKFDKRTGVLEIPPLIVQETTESVFRNLISFEQCYRQCPPRFTSYAKLMDHLIESAKDMEILCKEDIIDNWLTLEDSSKIFDKLYIDTLLKKFYHEKVYEDVDKYCKRWWPRSRANLMHNYFNTTWGGIGVVAAVFLFILTIIGAVCSIIQTI